MSIKKILRKREGESSHGQKESKNKNEAFKSDSGWLILPESSWENRVQISAQHSVPLSALLFIHWWVQTTDNTELEFGAKNNNTRSCGKSTKTVTLKSKHKFMFVLYNRSRIVVYHSGQILTRSVFKFVLLQSDAKLTCIILVINSFSTLYSWTWTE